MTRFTQRLATLAVAAAAAFAAACGGDGSDAGVGTGGSGYAVGTVTGFGSVIVDGTAWNDNAARVQVEVSPAAGTVTTTAKLGQRVLVEYETEPDAKVIEDWYVTRFMRLRQTAFRDPAAYFHRYAGLTQDAARAEALHIWGSINEKNLFENILPTRPRARLILRKAPDHRIETVALRRI